MKMKTLILPLMIVWLLAPVANRFIPLYIHDRAFVAEVADTLDKQIRGLMFRPAIADNYAMLFVYSDEQERGFWMKNTLIHLDIIFLNHDKQVVDMFLNVPPCRQEPCPTYTSKVPAQYVVEIRGNRACELGLKIGDTLYFPFDES